MTSPQPSEVEEGAPPPPPSLFKRIDNAVLAVNRWMLIIGMAAMSILIFAAVVLRYSFHGSIPWSEEVARYLMIWLTFIGLGPVFRIGGHISIDSLEASMPKKAARLLRLVVMAMVVAFFLFLIVTGIQYSMRTMVQSTPVTHVPFTWVAASIPVGFALSLWHLAAVVRHYILEREFEQSYDMDAAEVGAL